MAEYIVKHNSVTLPGKEKGDSGRTFKRGKKVEIEEQEQADRLLELGAIETEADKRKREEGDDSEASADEAATESDDSGAEAPPPDKPVRGRRTV